MGSVYDEDYHSSPWLIITGQGDDFVLGQKIDYSGDWYDGIKAKLRAELEQMEKLPREIPVSFDDQVGMGTRAEMRDLIKESQEEVASVREYELSANFDHLSRLRAPYEEVTTPEEMLQPTYWNSYLQPE